MGGKVRRSAYRVPPTAKGIEGVEKGTLKWFDNAMFSNFNTGLLEQYLDDKNSRESFDICIWTPWKIFFALVIGAGLLIIGVVFSQFGGQLKLNPIRLLFFGGYVICDLIRLRFLCKTTVSFGFLLIFSLFLIDSPLAALLIATLGS